MKCDCCNSEENVEVRASRCGPISWSYCEKCRKNGIEPYHALVVYASCAVERYEDIENEYFKKIVDRNLKFYGKSVEGFNKDLEYVNQE